MEEEARNAEEEKGEGIDELKRRPVKKTGCKRWTRRKRMMRRKEKSR